MRILHIMAGADAGGISTVVLNFYRHMDRERFHFDIALTTDAIGKNAREFLSLGCEIFRLPLKSKDLKGFEHNLQEILEKGNYHAIHVHENETSYVALRIAKRYGIKKRLAHSHTSSPTRTFREETRRITGCVLNRLYATDLIGCGQLAGERVFGKHFLASPKGVVLPNAIDVEKFRFDTDVRTEIRNELGLADRKAIGIVGRLSREKNYPFALQIMLEYHKIDPSALLVIVGNGDDEVTIRAQIKEFGLEENVLLLGRRTDVARLYMGFDVLMLPSLYEGFPVVGVEAITAGLPVLLADTITPELRFSKSVHYLPLTDVSPWLSALQVVERRDRFVGYWEVKNNALDIRDIADALQQIYLKG